VLHSKRKPVDEPDAEDMKLDQKLDLKLDLKVVSTTKSSNASVWKDSKTATTMDQEENIGHIALEKQQQQEFEDGQDTLVPILDKSKIENMSKLFDLDADAVEKMLLGNDPDIGTDGQNLDHCVNGTGFSINSASYPTDSDDEEPAAGSTTTKEAVEPSKWISSLESYLPPKFKGVDVKKWSEWTECMEFSKQNGIVVVEVYSVVFGPSEAMYPSVAEIVNQQRDRVKFVRLSLHTMSTMEVVHDAIKDHQHYYPSPEPTFLIMKNGKQMGQLKGTKPAELGKLIKKHVVMQQRAATAPVSPVSVKYQSILKRKAPGKQTSSSMFQTPRKQVPVTVREHGENIKNLLKASDSGLASCGSEHSSPTKLWKNEMVLVD